MSPDVWLCWLPVWLPGNLVSFAIQISRWIAGCEGTEAVGGADECLADGLTSVLLSMPSGRCVGRLRAIGERKLSRVSAQPMEDSADPLVILRDLPEREREEFLHQYHRAVDAAHDPAGYQQLRRLLHVWSLTAIAAAQPGYYEELADARAGLVTTVPVTDAIPDWAERAAATRDHR
jgi:Family of unknown function (DUF6247)